MFWYCVFVVVFVVGFHLVNRELRLKHRSLLILKTLKQRNHTVEYRSWVGVSAIAAHTGLCQADAYTVLHVLRDMKFVDSIENAMVGNCWAITAEGLDFIKNA